MGTDELAAVWRQVAERLDASGLPWCVMAGAAATCYGVTRPITDIDLFLQSEETDRILALFPEGQQKLKHSSPQEHALDFGLLEIWWGTLALKGGERFYPVAFDDALRSRITRRPLLGVSAPIMAAEDVLVLKAIMQRGPERGKHDLEDIQAIIQTQGQRLDRAYTKARALACEALERVAPCLQRFGLAL